MATRSDSIQARIQAGHSWDSNAAFYEDLRRSFDGRRDGWAWLYGLIVPLFTIALCFKQLKDIASLDLPVRVSTAFFFYLSVSGGVVLVIGLCFLLRQRWARGAMYTLPLIIAFLHHVFLGEYLQPQAEAQVIGQIIGGSIVPLIIYHFAINSVGNRAFFNMPIDEAELRKHWLAYSNRLALWSGALAFFLPVLIAGLFFVALEHWMGIEITVGVRFSVDALVIAVMAGNIYASLAALKRVNLSGIPPIGGRGYALIGVVVSALWIVGFILMGVRRVAVT